MTSSDRPSVAIVLPVRNEVRSLADTLDACLAQDYEGPLEVVVADGHSDDGTLDVLERYRTTDGIRIVVNDAHTAPAGLNRAIEATDAEIVVRCDGHAILPQDYVRRAVATLVETGAGNVGGVQRAVGRSPMQRGIARAMTNPVGVGDARFHRGGDPGPTDTVYLGVFPRDLIVRIGGFDERLDRNQDYELNVRIRAAGEVVWFEPLLEVDYLPRSSLRGLWNQFFDYGRWKRVVLRMHPGSMRPRQVGPPLLVGVLIGSAILLATPLRPIGIVAVGGYLALLAAVGIVEATRTRDVAGLLAAPAVGTMHLAWGSGFLFGRDQSVS